MNLGTLRVKLEAKADQYLKTMEAAEKKSASFAKAGAAVVAVGASIGVAMIASAQRTATLGDELQKTSIRTGFTTKQLSGLKFAAEQAGSNFNDVAVGLRRLAANAQDASQGTGTAKDSFLRLGIAVTDSAGKLRPMNDLLIESADKFSSLKNKTEAVALAQDIFGRSGNQLLPLLMSGSAGIAALAAQAEDLGIVYDRLTADQSADFIDSQNELKQSMSGLSLVVGKAIIPSLTKLVRATVEVVKRSKDFLNTNQRLIKFVGVLAATLTGAGGLLIGLAGVLKLLPLLKVGFAGVLGPVGLAAAGIAALVAVVVTFRKEIGSAMASVIGRFLETLEILVTALRGIPGVNKAFGNSIDSVTQKIGNARKFMEGMAVDLLKDEAALASMDQALGKTATTTLPEFSAGLATATSATIELTAAETDAIAQRSFMNNLIRETGRIAVENQVKAVVAEQESANFINNLIKGVADNRAKANVESLALSMKTIRENADFSLKMENDILAARQEKAGEAVKVHQESSKKIADALKSATADVRSSAGKIFDDMFLKGKNVFSSLGDLLKGGALSLGRAIFQDITAAFGGPILNAFRNFFKKTVGSLVGSLGSKLAGALGGLGIGSIGAAAPALTGIVAPIALPGAAVAGAGAGIGGAIAGLATNPVTIAAAAGLAAIIAFKKIGQGRKTADKFVQSAQNPFGDALGGIIGGARELDKAGKLTAQGALDAQAAVTVLWDEFQASAQQFSAQGQTEAKVVRQAFETLNPVVSTIMDELVDKVTMLQAEEESAAAALNVTTSATTAATRSTATFSSSITDQVVRIEAMRLKLVAAGLSGSTVADAMAAMTIGLDTFVKNAQIRIAELNNAAVAPPPTTPSDPPPPLTGTATGPNADGFIPKSPIGPGAIPVPKPTVADASFDPNVGANPFSPGGTGHFINDPFAPGGKRWVPAGPKSAGAPTVTQFEATSPVINVAKMVFEGVQDPAALMEKMNDLVKNGGGDLVASEVR